LKIVNYVTDNQSFRLLEGYAMDWEDAVKIVKKVAKAVVAVIDIFDN